MPRRDQPPSAPEATADRLHSAAIRLLRRLRAEDRASGLSGPRLSALSVIVFSGPLSMRDLAAAEQVRPPTITRLVRDLEKAGLVRRESDPHDRRVQLVAATAKGRRLLQRGRRLRVQSLAAEVAKLPPSDQRRLLAAALLMERLARGSESD